MGADPDFVYAVLVVVSALVGAVSELRASPLLERIARLEGKLEGMDQRMELLEQGYREAPSRSRDSRGRFEK